MFTNLHNVIVPLDLDPNTLCRHNALPSVIDVSSNIFCYYAHAQNEMFSRIYAVLWFTVKKIVTVDCLFVFEFYVNNIITACDCCVLFKRFSCRLSAGLPLRFKTTRFSLPTDYERRYSKKLRAKCYTEVRQVYFGLTGTNRFR